MPEPIVQRPGVRRGYDLWAESYDAAPSLMVRVDESVTPALLRPRRGERVLDAGCGTGRSFPALARAGGDVVGLDFSPGMLRTARRGHPGVPLVLADLGRPWPFGDGTFDAILCALVGEHLDRLPAACAEMRRVLRLGGRLVFSVYHPALAAAGKEAHFRRDGVEYRLGAVRHTVADYRAALGTAGFTTVTLREFRGDERLATRLPAAGKYIGFPLLLVLQARREA
jgi:malonyl-CoA O-methyltransferase